MSKKEVLTTLGASFLVISAFTLSQVFAGNNNQDNGQKNRPNFNPANQEAIEEAITNNDYTAWKELVGENNPLLDKITEANFSRFAEAHRLMIQARNIFGELGLEGHMGMGMNMGPGKGGYGMNSENFSALQEAFQNNDYNTWKELVGDNNPMSDKITEANFSRFAEAHQLLSEGNKDEAQTIFDGLGLNRGMGKGFGGGRFNQSN